VPLMFNKRRERRLREHTLENEKFCGYLKIVAIDYIDKKRIEVALREGNIVQVFLIYYYTKRQ
jgi:hypothetical protein